MKHKPCSFEIVSKKFNAFFLTPELDIEEVTVIDSDFDKYVTFLRQDGTEDSYKWAYLFSSRENAEKCKEYLESDCTRSCFPSNINPWKGLLSRKDYAAWLKAWRKERHSNTEYYVSVDSQSYSNSMYKCRSLHKALNYFLNHLNHEQYEWTGMGSQKHGNLLSYEDGSFMVWQDSFRGKYRSLVLKSRLIGPMKSYKDFEKNRNQR